MSTSQTTRAKSTAGATATGTKAIDRAMQVLSSFVEQSEQGITDIAARTGLPLSDVERSTEAIAGCSRSRLALERGLAALRQTELEALKRAIDRRPSGVIDHLRQYAEGDLAVTLEGVDRIAGHDYDWSLNDQASE